MAASLTITESVMNGGRQVSRENTFTGTGSASVVGESIADSTTDGLVAFALDVSQVKAIYIKSDQDITIETNSSSAPDNTLALKSNIPYVWYTNKYDALVFTADITKIYVTNASGSAATLDIEAVYDATP